MAKKRSGKNRSHQKIQDAFQLAERAEARDRGDNENLQSEEDQDEELPLKEGVLDARKFLKEEDQESDLEDEELDSDEALALDDDYDVLSSKFSQTIRDKQKRRKGKRSEESESSEDEGYSSIDESQLVTLSEAWDMDDRDSSKKKKLDEDVVLDDARESESECELDSEETEEKGDLFKNAPTLDSESGSEDEESGSEGDSEEETGSDESDETDSEDERAILGGSDDEDVELKSTLNTVKAKVKTPHEHRRLVNETREANVFSVPAGGEELSLADMLGGVEGADDAHLIDKDEEPKHVAVPLPKRIQIRNDRRAAYEITKEEVNKWRETVRTLQEADHLEFPLAPPATAEEQEEIDPEKELDALRFVPETDTRTELENKIHGILEAGALVDESKEATFEQIEAAKLSKEDMFKRTQELRRMRELMFRDEQRAKRIKKIKSKQYRKIRKRERLRDAELVEGSDAEEDPDEHDRKRAEERMSQKHKTQSLWAKQMIKLGMSKDALSREQLEEMLRSGERLRAKQLGAINGVQSDDNVSDIEREYENDEDDTAERETLGKGIMAMDFMKNAEENRRRENKKELEFLRGVDSNTGIEEFEGVSKEKNSINQLKNEGRRVYAPKAAAEAEDMEELEEELIHDYRDDEAKSLMNRMSGKSRGRERSAEDRDDSDASDAEEEPPAKKYKTEEQNASDFGGFSDESEKEDGSGSEEAEENPWLTVGDDENVTSAKTKKFSTVTEDSSKLSKAANKIEKHKSKQDKFKGSTKPATLIDMKKVMEVNGKGDVHGSDDEQSEEEDERDNRMFKQQGLIKEAFAGDDVVSEFQEEKRKLIEEEDDKEEDMTLPGWGSWGGSDAPKKPKKKYVRKIDGVVQKEKRQDKDKDNVIINERLNKHNLKYQSSNVPHPYETREQYERALRMPIGEEWASRATFQKATLPRVIVKQGTVVDPLKAPFK